MPLLHRSDYDNDKETLTALLRTTFHKTDGDSLQKGAIPHYIKQIIDIASRESSVFKFYIDDLIASDNQDLLSAFLCNSQRYVSILYEVVDRLVIEFQPSSPTIKDTLDIFIQHRLLIEANAQNIQTLDSQNLSQVSKRYPPDLLRRYQIFIQPPSDMPQSLVRDIRADSIGHYVSLKSVVTKISDVKPMMQVATYTCDVCACETYQIISNINFAPLIKCNSTYCVENKASGKLLLQTRGSKMTKFQEVKVQELSSEVPAGAIPRSMTVCMLGELCRIVKPGDNVLLSGILFPTSTDVISRASSGSDKGANRPLSCDMYIQAHSITVINKLDGSNVNIDQLTSQEIAAIHEDNFYEKLACSIAPEIYGYKDLKKALLLTLIGGTSQHVGQMHIRGDIHMIMMGDPGVAKSQLLSFISRLSPRSYQVSGQSSSGVGLTASIVKDSLTNETTLQGGALVLSDGGLCCIDEFDKMPEHDRTAIHEVMEQQTVSIAKAGINAMLNARTSILAAANPAFSRYDMKKSLTANINLPSALLSRFDILWLLRDQSDKENDLRLAEHIVYVHKHSQAPELNFVPIDSQLMKKYISFARTKQPKIPENLTAVIVNKYVDIRKESRNMKNSTFLSARALLSILRLSTALAKLRLSDEVNVKDVQEAFRLIEVSQESLKSADSTIPRRSKSSNPVQKIFDILKEMFESIADNDVGDTIKMQDFLERCFALGFRQDQVDNCLREYSDINVIYVNDKRTSISLI